MVWGISGRPSIGPQWCREIPVSWTTGRPVCVVFPAWPGIRQTRKTTLDTRVSRHHGWRTEGSPETPWTITALYCIEGFQGSLNLDPKMVDSRTDIRLITFFSPWRVRKRIRIAVIFSVFIIITLSVVKRDTSEVNIHAQKIRLLIQVKLTNIKSWVLCVHSRNV